MGCAAVHLSQTPPPSVREKASPQTEAHSSRPRTNSKTVNISPHEGRSKEKATTTTAKPIVVPCTRHICELVIKMQTEKWFFPELYIQNVLQQTSITYANPRQYISKLNSTSGKQKVKTFSKFCGCKMSLRNLRREKKVFHWYLYPRDQTWILAQTHLLNGMEVGNLR